MPEVAERFAAIPGKIPISLQPLQVFPHRKQPCRLRPRAAGRRCDSCVRWLVETSRATSPEDLYIHRAQRVRIKRHSCNSASFESNNATGDWKRLYAGKPNRDSSKTATATGRNWSCLFFSMMHYVLRAKRPHTTTKNIKWKQIINRNTYCSASQAKHFQRMQSKTWSFLTYMFQYLLRQSSHLCRNEYG